MWVIMAKSVTSAPEPEVVGMAARGMGSPEKYTMALAASMGLPPPRATTRSGWKAFSLAVPRAISSAVGSGVT